MSWAKDAREIASSMSHSSLKFGELKMNLFHICSSSSWGDGGAFSAFGVVGG